MVSGPEVTTVITVAAILYCSSVAPLLSLQSFYNYARGHCETAQTFNCSGVCWEEGLGDGGVLVLQDVGTMKSLRWRCKMWFDCVKQKRSANLSWSATGLCTFAAAPSFQACLRAFHMYILYVCVHICVCVYVCMCADMYICMYMHVCMYLYIYAFIHMCMCMCIHICA